MYNPDNCTAALGESSQKGQGAAHPTSLERGLRRQGGLLPAEGCKGTAPRGDIRCAPSPNVLDSELSKVPKAPPLDHNPQGVTDVTMNPHLTLQWGPVEETDTAGDCITEDSVPTLGVSPAWVRIPACPLTTCEL